MMTCAVNVPFYLPEPAKPHVHFSGITDLSQVCDVSLTLRNQTANARSQHSLVSPTSDVCVEHKV